MPIYSATLVKKPRIWRWCATCDGSIMPGEETVKMFGCAEQGDPPYLLYIHRDCAYRSSEDKVRALCRPIPADILSRPLPVHQ